MRFFLILLFIFSTVHSQAQTKKTLESKKSSLQREIQKINRLLSNSKKKEDALLNRLYKLRKISNVREKFIKNLSGDIKNLSGDISKKKLSIQTLSEDLKTLKTNYARNVENSYKHRLEQNKLLFILSARTFYQGFLRFQYLKQYSRYTKNLVEKISEKRTALKELSEQLSVQKKSKESSLIEIAIQKEKDQLDRKKQKKLLSVVKSKSKKYKLAIRKKEAERKKIDREIQRLIRLAISNSNKNKNSSSFALTPEAKRLANDFAKNKGKLPWPVKTALVVRRFGKGIPHETVKGIKITSNGIHIATDSNSDVRSVFRGKVIAISVSGNGVKNVLIQHGNYVSVYGNLHPVYVSKGNEIASRQLIGKVHTNAVTRKTILKIQIWKGLIKQDPQKWLLKL